MAKLFTIAGTSVLNGVRTYRFANGDVKVRVGVLKRNDHTDIQMFVLPEAMEKAAAIQWLNSQGIDAVVPVTGRRKVELTPEQIAELERIAAEERAAREAAEAEQLAKDAEWINQIGIDNPMDDFNYVGSPMHY